MCSLLSLPYVFLDHPSDLPFLWIHTMRDMMASQTLRFHFYGFGESPTPTSGTRQQPNPFGLCLVPVGNHLILAKRRMMQPHRELFSSFREAKKCQCLHIACISLASDHLREPSPEAWCCRSRDKPLRFQDSLGSQWQRRTLLKLEPLHWQCRIKITFKPNVNEMAQAPGRLCAFFLLD